MCADTSLVWHLYRAFRILLMALWRVLCVRVKRGEREIERERMSRMSRMSTLDCKNNAAVMKQGGNNSGFVESYLM